MLTRKLKVFSKEWLCPERNAGYLQAMMFRISSFKVVLLRRESWDCTMRDRASRANESPCQPHLTPYEIHGEPQGIYYPQPGFGLPEYLMTAHPGIDLFPLCFCSLLSASFAAWESTSRIAACPSSLST